MRRLGGFVVLLIWVWGMGIGCRQGRVERGRIVFRQKCAHCHTVGRGKRMGPDLKGVTKRWEGKALRAWLVDPDAVYRERGRRPINPKFSPMPRVTLTPEEVADLLAYLSSI